MSQLLSVPMKKSLEVDMVTPLENLIQNIYSIKTGDRTASPNFTEAVSAFNNQRNTAMAKFYEKHESSLETVYSYYDQLCELEAKIPAGELQVSFKWKSAFDKSSIFGGRMSLALNAISFEKVCVLFNIAALQSAVASSQNMDSDKGLKLAIRLYQQAGGIFQSLKATVPTAIPQAPTPDLTQNVLQALCSLMIAQAQEIFVQKAIRENMNPLIVAKLCCQCKELYADVHRGMQWEGVRSVWDKEYTSTVSGKEAAFHAMAELYTSLDCRYQKKVGEEISRLQYSVKLFKTAQKRSGKTTLMHSSLVQAQSYLSQAVKDNDIYNQVIPDVKSLESPGKVQLAKPFPMAAKLSKDHKDLFADLVPADLHAHAQPASELRREEIVNAELLKLRKATQRFNVFLSHMSLQAASDASVNKSVMTSSVLEKSREVKSIVSVQKVIKELPVSLQRNTEILDECERMLKVEQDSDDKMRKQFKEKWTRLPSRKINKSFLGRIAKYRKIISNAVQADKVVQEKFETHCRAIEVISGSQAEGEQGRHADGGSIGNSGACLQRLRQLMDQVEICKAERNVIEEELQLAAVDVNCELNELQAEVQESLLRQEELAKGIEMAYAVVKAEKRTCNNNREAALLSQLATASDIFVEVQSNLDEGTKFYSKLTQLLIVFQNKISDFSFARETEKEELIEDLARQTGPTAA